MTRFVLLTLFLLPLTACRSDETDSGALEASGTCWEEDADCCCPEAGTGIDCMPAVSGCTMWMIDSCDVYCATF